MGTRSSGEDQYGSEFVECTPPGNSAFIASRPATSIPITTTDLAPEGTGAATQPPEMVNVAPPQLVASQTVPPTVPWTSMKLGTARPRSTTEYEGGCEAVP